VVLLVLAMKAVYNRKHRALSGVLVTIIIMVASIVLASGVVLYGTTLFQGGAQQESISVSGLKMWVHGTETTGLAWGAFAVRNTGDKVLSVDRIVVRGEDVPFKQWYVDSTVTSALIQQAMKFPGWLGTGGNLAVDDPSGNCATELIRIDLDGAGFEDAVCGTPAAGPVGLDPGDNAIVYFKLTNGTLDTVDGGATSSVSVFAGNVGAPQSISIASKT